MNQVSGISLKNIFSSAPEAALKDYIGSQTINILSALSPNLLNKNELIELALNKVDTSEIIRNQEVRNQIIQLLPVDKAQELASKLGITVRNNQLYEQLQQSTITKETHSTLMSFLGIVLDNKSSYISGKPFTRIEPKYGLFTHQQHAANRALQFLLEPPHKLVLHMPTGAGKTRTAMHIIAQTINKNPNKLVIWLAQSAELLEQAAEEFEKAWQFLGNFPSNIYRFWGSQEPNISEAKTGFLVAGFAKINALYKRDPNMIMRLGDRSILTVVDEAHQAIAPTYKSIISFIHEKKPTNMLLGLTATPGRTWADVSEDEQLSNFFGKQKVSLEIEGYSDPIKYLVEEGYLAKPVYKTLNIDAGLSLSHEDRVKLSQSYDIPETILDNLANNEVRNIKIITCAEDLKLRHRRVIIFTSTVAHAHLISSILNIRGTKSFCVTGETEKDVREHILYVYKSSNPEPIVICNYGVLTTGFDAPQTSAAIIARPTMSLVLYSQMVGRAIRGPKAGGNDEAEIITVVDPTLVGFGCLAEAFNNWEDVWNNDENR